MPSRLAYPCAWPTCPALIHKGKYCDKHRPAPRQRTRAQERDTRYSTWAWRKTREAVIARDRSCRCGSTQRLTVHHLVETTLDMSDEMFFDPAVCLLMCKDCHERTHDRKR